MSKKYLLDTCVWRDYYENRFSKSGKPLGKYAANLFIRILKNKDKIIFSEALIWELKKDYREKDIYDMLNLLFVNNILIKIEVTKEDFLEAKKLSQEKNVPFVDCLNSVQARNHRAILVSQDQHFIKKLSDIVKPIKPEDIR